jgi:4-hydroxy-tetrahydrodipicolinate synthase
VAVIRGLSAFPITPADEAGRVDVGALRALVRRLVEAGVDSIGLLGSTGTYAYLSRAERRRAIEAALAETGGRTPLLVGVGALRTDEAVRLAEDARAAGADAGLLAPVSYTPLTDDEVFEHFSAVAGAGLPLCIYNNPGTTHFTFSPALVGRLSRLAGVVAVKNPAAAAETVAAQHAALRAEVSDGFSLGYSVDWNAAEALIAGGETWYSVAGGLFPAACLPVMRAVQAGDVAEARRLNDGLRPLWDLFRTHTGLRVVYAAANLAGLCRADPPRPILPLAPAVRDEVGRVMDELRLR